PPVAVPDVTLAEPDRSITYPVLANDYDPDNDPLQLVGLTAPLHGTAAIDEFKNIVYTPATGFTGTDVVGYVITDGQLQATTTLTIIIARGNQPPVAVDDAFVTPQDTPFIFRPTDLLLNDSDPDGDPVTLVSTQALTLPNGS